MQVSKAAAARSAQAPRRATASDADAAPNQPTTKDTKRRATKVEEAIADGQVTDAERALFERGTSDVEVANLKDRIRDTVTAAIDVQQRRDAGEEPVGSAQSIRDGLGAKVAMHGIIDAELVAQRSIVEDSADDFQQLRTEAQPLLDQFNANGGQWHEADMFGDDWDSQDYEITFDHLVDEFADDPDLLADWAGVQGAKDSHDLASKSPEELEAYLADRNDEDAARIRARYEATVGLTAIMERYIDVSGDEARAAPQIIDQLTAEQADLRNSISSDLQALDAIELADVQAQQQREATSGGAVVRPLREDPLPEDREPASTPAPSPSPASGAPDTDTYQTPDSPPLSEQIILQGSPVWSTPEPTPEPEPEPTPVPNQSPVQAPVEVAPVAPAVPTDAELLDAAAAAGIIDASVRDRFAFNEAGELTYAAQPGDGYWHAAEHVAVPEGQDFSQLWMGVWNTNSMRNHGVPDEQFVGVDQPIAYPCYTRESLRQLTAAG